MTLTKPRILVAVLALIVIVGLVAGGVFIFKQQSTPKAHAAPASIPAQIKLSHLPKDATLGVVVTFGESAQNGAEWNQAAQGAAVAQRRLAMGGSSVKLHVQGDRGTDAGAREAVKKLVKQEVSGIVLATDGPQTAEAVRVAKEHHVPVILPYASQDFSQTEAAWTTAPSTGQMKAGYEEILKDSQRALEISEGGQSLPGSVALQTVELTSNTDLDKLAQSIAVKTGDARKPDSNHSSGKPQSQHQGTKPGALVPENERIDAVVVSVSTARQVEMVKALQRHKVSAPLVLSHTATSPHFAQEFASQDGHATSTLVTASSPDSDAVALQPDEAGRAMSAFLATVRTMAEDSGQKDLYGEQAFAAVAGGADARSHDAVVALAYALNQAQATDSQKVQESLVSLKLSGRHGLAGQPLDFSKPEAFAGKVEELHASNQNLALRPVTEGKPQRLTWFPVN